MQPPFKELSSQMEGDMKGLVIIQDNGQRTINCIPPFISLDSPFKETDIKFTNVVLCIKLLEVDLPVILTLHCMGGFLEVDYL